MINRIPTIEEIKLFLDHYGWKYNEVKTEDGQHIIVSGFSLRDQKKGIFVTFFVEGEFVMVSTKDFLKSIPKEYSAVLMQMNDTLKLVKLYAINKVDSEDIDAELGFELWQEAWNQETFFAFMDMFCLGIEKTLEKFKLLKIPHETKFLQ